MEIAGILHNLLVTSVYVMKLNLLYVIVVKLVAKISGGVINKVIVLVEEFKTVWML